MFICTIVQDDWLVLAMSHDFTKRSIGMKGEITNSRIVSELSLLSASQILCVDNGDMHLKQAQRQCNKFEGMRNGWGGDWMFLKESCANQGRSGETGLERGVSFSKKMEVWCWRLSSQSPAAGPEGGSEPEPEPPELVSSPGFDTFYLYDLGQVI